MANQHTHPEPISERIVRLENELDSMIRMFSFAREVLEREMMGGGLVPGKHGLNEAVTKKLKELTQGMASMVEAKIRYDRTKKELAKNMTPEEEMSAVVAYIVNLSHDDWEKLKDRIQAKGRWKS